MKKRFHVFSDDAMGDLDAVGISERLRKREVSINEITEAAIARCDAAQEKTNAIELPLYDKARARTDLLPDGVFTGVPTFIKDNTDIVGVPTRHGSHAVRLKRATRTGAFAQQFMSTGLHVLGKSRLPEFGFNATTEYDRDPPVRNPWNGDYSPGGSSGGSAALVAAGAVPIAHANDGGGSIRIPAACCGLIGLKPSRGRLVDSEATRTLPVNIVSEGVVTRSVRDSAYFLHAAEQYRRSKKFDPVGLVTSPGKRRLRIGIVYDSILGHSSCSQTRAAVSHTASLLESAGHFVEEVTLPIPAQFASDFRSYWGMLAFLAGKFGHVAFGRGFDIRQLDGLSKGLSREFSRQIFSAPAILYRLQKSARTYSEIFAQHDLLLSPVLAHTTPEIDYLSPNLPFDTLIDRLTRYVSFTPANNASGGPAISLPMGKTDKDLPIGIQFSADHGDERTLLEIAYELELMAPWRRIQDVPA